MVILDEIVRPVLGLVEYTSEVFADDAEADELHGTEEEHDTDESGVSGYGVAVDDGLDKYIDEVYESSYSSKETHDRCQPQGCSREAGDALNG